MLGNFYFKRSNGEKVFLGEFDSELPRSIIKKIHSYTAELNPDYKIYYTRYYFENGVTHIDVGSHAEEFIFEGELSL